MKVKTITKECIFLKGCANKTSWLCKCGAVHFGARRER